VLSAGVDLAAEPKGTALAVVEWSAGHARLVDLQLGVGDGAIVEVANQVEKIGIDCALGWPVEFVDFVVQHSDLESTQPDVDGGMDWRRRLAYRETDRFVRERTKRWPLSVSTDRLGLTAMRCAGLLARIQASGIAVDRAGFGTVVEVYPGATLRLWGFDTTGYRISPGVRATLLSVIQDEAPWFDFAPFAPLMISSGDAFDAVIAAMAARNAALGNYEAPSAAQMERARTEGWIALPTGPISDLIGAGAR
jgi:hypothetical protein